MTTRKERKRSNLRHAEYYDFQSIQDELYAKSLKNTKFTSLIEIIIQEENIKLAYRNIKKNKGSMTKGSDKRNIKDIEKLTEKQLIELVRKKLKWYTPQQIRRVEIPKSNGKLRPLGIPTIMDRLIQQCILQVLEPICEAKFYERSYGFRPNRNQSHALAEMYRKMQIHGLHYVIDIDIKGFFDNVNHSKLLKQMWFLGIRDKKLLSILSTMLKAEVAGIGFPIKGMPQGGIISPLLSNIVLNELDWWISSQWEEFPSKTKYSRYAKANGVLDHGAKFRFLKQTGLKECWIIRFADDFKIFTRNYKDAAKMYHATKKWLKERLNLEISEEKSQIVNLRQNYSEFLGFKIKLQKRGKNRQNNPKYVVKSNISDKAKNNINTKLNALINQMKSSNDKEVYSSISLYNSYVIGIHQYYGMATNICKDLGEISFHSNKSLKIKLGNRLLTRRKLEKRKLNCLIPQYIKTYYGKSRQLLYVDKYALIPLGYWRFQKPVNRKRTINAYTPKGRMEIHKELNKIDKKVFVTIMKNPVKYRSIEYNDNRLSLYAAQQGKCAITKQILTLETIHCHHKVPLKYGGNDSYSNLVLLTNTVHILVHATKRETINLYLNRLQLNEKQITKLNELRKLAKVECILI